MSDEMGREREEGRTGKRIIIKEGDKIAWCFIPSELTFEWSQYQRGD